MYLFYWVAKLMSLLLISMFGFKIDKKLFVISMPPEVLIQHTPFLSFPDK